MSFSPYTHDTAGHELVIKDDGVYVKIRGSESYQSGAYTNSRNLTVEVKLPDGEVERVVRELAGEYDDCKEDHAMWAELQGNCPVCGVELT